MQFPRQNSFRNARHSDDIAAKSTEHFNFSRSLKSWPISAEVHGSLPNANIQFLQNFKKQHANFRTIRLRQVNMRYRPFIKKSNRTPPGKVDKVMWNNNVGRHKVTINGAHSINSNYSFHPNFAKSRIFAL